MNPELVKKMLDVIASGDEKAALALLAEAVAGMAGAGDAPPADADPLGETADAPPADPLDDPKDEPLSALSKALGFKSDADAATEIKKLFKEIGEQRAAAAKLELDARCGLVAELVSLGIEFPATAWKRGADGKPNGKAPADRLMAEPLADLRARVALHKSQGGRKVNTPPVTDETKDAPLSADLVTLAKKKGLTPEQFNELRKNAVRRI